MKVSWTWKTFSGALLELLASLVPVDYWHNAGPFAAIYWGKILFARVHVSLLQGGTLNFLWRTFHLKIIAYITFQLKPNRSKMVIQYKIYHEHKLNYIVV